MFPLVFFVIRLKVGKGIGLSSNSQLGIINMRIYLRRVQVIMPQQLLKRAHVNSVLQHKRCGGMAQLVR